MKVVKLVFALLLMIGATQIQAQSKVKIGHIDQEKISQQLPAWDSVKVKVTALEERYTNEYKSLEDYAKQKQADYIAAANDPATPEIVLANIKDEFEKLSYQLNVYWQEKQPEFQKEAQALQQPVLDLVEEAIKAVAEREGYTYVVEKSMFYFAADSHDITHLVLKELGVEPTK